MLREPVVVPALTVDAVLLKGSLARPDRADVLLVRRGHPPFVDHWALPGGFVDVGESTERACVRELMEETGLIGRLVGVLGVYSTPGRDPRGSTISAVYMTAIAGLVTVGLDDEVSESKWFPLESLPEALAFDHAEILHDAGAWFSRHGLAPFGDDDLEACM